MRGRLEFIRNKVWGRRVVFTILDSSREEKDLKIFLSFPLDIYTIQKINKTKARKYADVYFGESLAVNSLAVSF